MSHRLQGFKGHRDIVAGLAFRGGTHELSSASFDRSVKLWSLDDRTHMDTLLGHQAEVLAIDMLRQVSLPPMPCATSMDISAENFLHRQDCFSCVGRGHDK